MAPTYFKGPSTMATKRVFAPGKRIARTVGNTILRTAMPTATRPTDMMDTMSMSTNISTTSVKASDVATKMVTTVAISTELTRMASTSFWETCCRSEEHT